MSIRRTIAEADLSTLNVAAFCRVHGISRDRFYEIRKRFDAEGDAGLEPRSRAPRVVANRTLSDVEDVIVRLRKELIELGVDAGAATIAFHLPAELGDGVLLPSESTIWRVLTRRGFIVADPSKAPKRPARSFSANRANECWQIDDTEWFLAAVVAQGECPESNLEILERLSVCGARDDMDDQYAAGDCSHRILPGGSSCHAGGASTTRVAAGASGKPVSLRRSPTK